MLPILNVDLLNEDKLNIVRKRSKKTQICEEGRKAGWKIPYNCG